MKINYDKDIDAKYVSIKKGKVHSTKSICGWLFFDLNKKGEVLGVEILDATKNEVTLYTDGKDLTYYEFSGQQTENIKMGTLDTTKSRLSNSPVLNTQLQYA